MTRFNKFNKYFSYYFFRVQSIFVYIYFLVQNRFRINNYYRKPNHIKRKDRIFILGSGSSPKTLSDGFINHMEKSGAVFAFNASVDYSRLNIDYCIVREEFYIKKQLFNYDFKFVSNKKLFMEFSEKFQKDHLKTTWIFLNVDRVSGSNICWYNSAGNLRNRISFYKNTIDRQKNWPPSEKMINIPHGSATLFDAINISYILGYKEIVLVGVDLYDSKYFNLPNDKTREFDLNRNRKNTDIHGTAPHVIEGIVKWKEFFKKKGINIFVENPKSLIANEIDIYNISN